MSEKLIIRNFGPITNVDLDLRKVNVLIGDQGTGKSTVAKVLTVLKLCNISSNSYAKLSIESSGLIKEEIKNRLKVVGFVKDFSYYEERLELKNYRNASSYIYYENRNFIAIITGFNIQFEVKSFEDENTSDINYFIPAFREAYILLRDNYPAILNARANLPELLNSFGQSFNNYKASMGKLSFQNLIGIDYEYVNGFDNIILRNGKSIRFEEASSAVNSVVPMLVVFLGVLNEMKPSFLRYPHLINCPFVIIEEPELNCFPTTQKKIVEFLIAKSKTFIENKETYFCNLLLTTHSPYILTSLNNLMYAYEVGKEHGEKTEKVIERKYWLNPNDVAAYEMKKDGTCEDIFDRDESLIKVEKIDEISTVLNKDFNELINIEIGLVNEKH